MAEFEWDYCGDTIVTIPDEWLEKLPTPTDLAKLIDTCPAYKDRQAFTVLRAEDYAGYRTHCFMGMIADQLVVTNIGKWERTWTQSGTPQWSYQIELNCRPHDEPDAHYTYCYSSPTMIPQFFLDHIFGMGDDGFPRVDSNDIANMNDNWKWDFEEFRTWLIEEHGA